MSGTTQTTLDITRGQPDEPEIGEDQKPCPKCGTPVYKVQWPQHIRQCEPDDGGSAR